METSSEQGMETSSGHGNMAWTGQWEPGGALYLTAFHVGSVLHSKAQVSEISEKSVCIHWLCSLWWKAFFTSCGVPESAALWDPAEDSWRDLEFIQQPCGTDSNIVWTLSYYEIIMNIGDLCIPWKDMLESRSFRKKIRWSVTYFICTSLGKGQKLCPVPILHSSFLQALSKEIRFLLLYYCNKMYGQDSGMKELLLQKL